jgi:D-serine deaminase-like pyridoxal phosphate-dependent protein
MTALAYSTIRTLLAGERLPVAFVDVDAFDRNLDRHVALVARHGKLLRVATKSVRAVALLRRLLERGGGVLRGLMCFSTSEAEFLAGSGLDDLLLAYPPFQERDLTAILRLTERGTRLRVAVDSRETLDRLSERGVRRGVAIEAVLCVDMSLRAAAGRVHLGVRRSPLHTPGDVLALARHARTLRGVTLQGLLCYEAQVAGLGDDSPFEPWLNPLKSAIRRLSVAEVSSRRSQIVETLRRDGFSLPLVNGGGTGSLETTAPEPAVSEVTAGSGFFKPHLFDYYRSAHVRALEPACFFALEVTRKPDPEHVTCLGGGYVASGAPGRDKVPLPWLPRGLSLLPHEMCGEVQTPLRVTPGVELGLGDPVIFRHAKAGELCERFAELLLITAGRVVDRVPTYRGEGRCFS